MKKAHVLLFDGYADWEIGYALAELRRMGGIEVAAVGFTPSPVRSMGGLRVTPDLVLSQVEPQDVLILILPGGHLWEGDHPRAEVEHLLLRLERERAPIAAICAATTVLARAGLLQGRKHTSNALAYLAKLAPEYTGQENYLGTLSARDQGVITASGLGAVEFTADILNELNVATPEAREFWFNAFKHGIYPA